MTPLKILAVDAITAVSADVDHHVARIHFRQGGDEAAMEFDLGNAEKVSQSLASILFRMARERGIAVARTVEQFELHPNLEGASLVLADSLTSESLHLDRAQMQALYSALGSLLAAEAAQAIQ